MNLEEALEQETSPPNYIVSFQVFVCNSVVQGVPGKRHSCSVNRLSIKKG